MGLEYIKITPEILLKIVEYSDDEQGRLLLAMARYALDGTEPEFEGAERFVWPSLRMDIDVCAAYVEKQQGNGGKGGRPAKKKAEESANNPTKTQEKPTETQEKPTETQEKPTETQEKPKYKNQYKDQYKNQYQKEEGEKNARVARFAPPTPEEVTACFREKGGNDDQALRFTAHYASNGWMRGAVPMVDWQAAVTKWILEDRDKKTIVGRSSQAHSPPNGDQMQRYTPEQRRQTYAAATVDLDAME